MTVSDINKKRKKKTSWLVKLLFGFGGLIAILGILLITRAYPFLAKNAPIDDARILAVEAWLPYYAVEAVVREIEASDYDHIVVVGGSRDKDFFKLGEHDDESLTFHFDQAEAAPQSAKELTFDAMGVAVSHLSPQLKVLVNEEEVGEVFINDDVEDYTFPTGLEVGDTLRTIKISLVNGNASDGGDFRLLYMGHIRLGNLMVSPYSESVIHGFRVSSGEYVKNQQHLNAADHTAYFLRELGVDQDKISAVRTPPTDKSDTYGNAASFARWLEQEGSGENRINLFSQAAHARRSYDMYKKALGEDIYLGVIATDHFEYNKSWWRSKVGWRNMSEQIIKYAVSKLFIDQIAE